jgi:hypothetical protein
MEEDAKLAEIGAVARQFSIDVNTALKQQVEQTK